MRQLLRLLLLTLLCVSPSLGQTHIFPALDTNNPWTGSNSWAGPSTFTGIVSGVPTGFAGTPTGACLPQQLAQNLLTGAFYDCLNGVWNLITGGGGGGGSVISFSAGNMAPVFTTSVANPTTTPALTFSLSTATAHTFLGNNTGSTTAPSYVGIGAPDLPASIVYNNQTNTFTAAGAIDLSGSTVANALKAPAVAGFTTGINGSLGYDTTNKNWHLFGNAIDNFGIVMPTSVAPNNNDCAKFTVSAGTVTLNTAGAACGVGFANPMTTFGDMIFENNTPAPARLAGPTTNGTWVLISPVTASASVAPQWTLMGVVPNAQVGTTYTVQGENTASSDRLKYVTFSNASPIAVTLPPAGSAGFGSNFAFVACDIGAGTATISPTTSTISFSNGSSYSSAQASLALTTGQCAWVYSDNTNYFAIVRSGGGGGGSSALSAITAAVGSNTISNGNFPQLWNWTQTTDGQAAFAFGEAAAATSGTLTSNFANQSLLKLSTATASTETPFSIIQGSVTGATGPAAMQVQTTWNNASLVGEGLLFNVTDTSSAAGSLLFDFRKGNTSQIKGDKNGNLIALTSLQTTASAPGCTAGGAGFWCAIEGTAFTNVAGTSGVYPDSTTHEYLAKTNGSANAGMLVRAQPGSVLQTGQTGVINTATLCAAAAGACNVAGTYHLHFDFWGSGTACSSVTSGSVTFLLTWTDPNGTTHSAVALQMISQTGAATVNPQPSFGFQTALANESASGDYTFDTNGSVIQYATGYVACTTGTGTYNLAATVTRLR